MTVSVYLVLHIIVFKLQEVHELVIIVSHAMSNTYDIRLKPQRSHN